MALCSQTNCWTGASPHSAAPILIYPFLIESKTRRTALFEPSLQSATPRANVQSTDANERTQSDGVLTRIEYFEYRVISQQVYGTQSKTWIQLYFSRYHQIAASEVCAQLSAKRKTIKKRLWLRHARVVAAEINSCFYSNFRFVIVPSLSANATRTNA